MFIKKLSLLLLFYCGSVKVLAGIEDLPKETLVHVFSFLEAKETGSLSTVNRKFCELSQSEYLRKVSPSGVLTRQGSPLFAVEALFSNQEIAHFSDFNTFLKAFPYNLWQDETEQAGLQHTNPNYFRQIERFSRENIRRFLDKRELELSSELSWYKHALSIMLLSDIYNLSAWKAARQAALRIAEIFVLQINVGDTDAEIYGDIRQFIDRSSRESGLYPENARLGIKTLAQEAQGISAWNYAMNTVFSERRQTINFQSVNTAADRRVAFQFILDSTRTRFAANVAVYENIWRIAMKEMLKLAPNNNEDIGRLAYRVSEKVALIYFLKNSVYSDKNKGIIARVYYAAFDRLRARQRTETFSSSVNWTNFRNLYFQGLDEDQSHFTNPWLDELDRIVAIMESKFSSPSTDL
mgnify:FL=1